jgi:MFS family permease
MSGLLLLPVTAGQATSAVLATRILRRTGDPHLIPVLGMSLTSCALLLIAVLPPHIGTAGVLGFVAGLGLGTVMPINQTVVQVVAGRTRLGAVTATVSLARSTGGAAGAALMGALVFAFIPDADRATLVQKASEMDLDVVIRAFHRAFLFAATLAALAAFTAYRMPRIKLWEPAKRRGLP